LWKSPRSLAKRDLSQWLLEDYGCGARRPHGRVHIWVSSDQDQKLHMLQKYVSILSGAQGLAKKAVDQR
jgi:hypothetical protein